MTIKQELIKYINNLETGEQVSYWVIADMFDEIDDDGNINYEIVDVYDYVLDELVENGLIKWKEDYEGVLNIIVKQ